MVSNLQHVALIINHCIKIPFQFLSVLHMHYTPPFLFQSASDCGKIRLKMITDTMQSSYFVEVVFSERLTCLHTKHCNKLMAIVTSMLKATIEESK